MKSYCDTYFNDNIDKKKFNTNVRELNDILENKEISWAIMNYDDENFSKKWLSRCNQWKYNYYYLDLKDKSEKEYKWLIIIHNPKEIIDGKTNQKFDASTHHFFVDMLESYKINKNKNHQLWVKYPRRAFINDKSYNKIYMYKNGHKIDFKQLIGDILKTDIYYSEIYQIKSNNKIVIKID